MHDIQSKASIPGAEPAKPPETFETHSGTEERGRVASRRETFETFETFEARRREAFETFGTFETLATSGKTWVSRQRRSNRAVWR